METVKSKNIFVFIIIFLTAGIYMTGMPFFLLEFNVENKAPIYNVFYIVNTLLLVWPVVMIIVCIINLKTIKINQAMNKDIK